VVALKELAEGTENKDILTDFEENRKAVANRRHLLLFIMTR
jgi:hypothetical protein